jgi:hypothetical protein
MKLQEKIFAAFAESDAVGILNMVNQGVVPLDWRDDVGRTLLHYAAAFGMRNVAKGLVERGAPVLVFDDNGLRPRDVAMAFGYAGVLNVIWAQHDFEIMHVEEKMPYDSLSAIRDAGALEDMIRRGFLPQVCVLAATEGFCADDFLCPGKFAPRVLDTLCQEDMLSMVMKPELWFHHSDDFEPVYAALPRPHRKKINPEPFRTAMRRTEMKSMTKPRLRGGPSS